MRKSTNVQLQEHINYLEQRDKLHIFEKNQQLEQIAAQKRELLRFKQMYEQSEATIASVGKLLVVLHGEY